jgi:hypothetical protein
MEANVMSWPKRLDNRHAAFALSIAVMVLVSACFNDDLQFNVHNESSETWLIRVTIGGSDGDEQVVRIVDPGADGPAVGWMAGRSVRIELLRQDCTVVGAFQSADGKAFSVAGFDGISGAIVPANLAGQDPHVHLTGDCGGTVFM